MLDAQDLKKFLSMPPIFNHNVIKCMENAVDEFDECDAYISNALKRYGENSYRNPDAYENVEVDVRWAQLGETYTEKLLAVLEKRKKEDCKEDVT